MQSGKPYTMPSRPVAEAQLPNKYFGVVENHQKKIPALVNIKMFQPEI